MSLLPSYPETLSLKDYQRRVLEEIEEYATLVGRYLGIGEDDPAGLAFYRRTNRPFNSLENNPETPFVCLKVPTGGGKTLIASCTVSLLYDSLLTDKDETGVVLWLTPSETIRSQTLRALKDQNHPYRKVLESGFSKPVSVLSNEEALKVRPDQVRDGVCVIVSTMQAMKREDKEGLKAYEENGYLQSHFTGEEEKSGVTFSLFEVIRRSRPLVIADEGHNYGTELSVDLLGSLNPSFVLELTATPAKGSNVISEVSALELKEEQMVKLPINLANETHWESALRGAVDKRQELEEAAKQERAETGEYIRPMLLVQAEQDKENPDKIHVARVKEFLVGELGIPEPQIKTRTGSQDELGSTDLMAEDVEVRYIITRDALKEGWDAPFAYVLASVFNLGSPKAVEQLLGRILRLPNVREKQHEKLNEAYVYTSAEQFNKAVDSIVKGMVENGYSKYEVRDSSSPMKYMVSMQARYEGLEIPLMAVKTRQGSSRELRYVQDLLGANFDLSGISFDANDLNKATSQGARLDVDQDRPIIMEMAEMEGVSGTVVETPQQMTSWLLSKIGRYNELADKNLRRYVEDAVDELLKTYSAEELYRMKYHVRDRLKQNLDEHYLQWAKSSYEHLKSAGDLVADTDVSFSVPDTLELPHNQCTVSFLKSVFEYPGKFNTEEQEFATKLDALDNVGCWYRNLDKGGFSLQGYQRQKFNPDLIAFMESGKIAVLEWKGKDRSTDAATEYKEALGNDWQALDPDNRYFKVVTVDNVQSTLNEVSEL